jgi:hypothetical protein
VNARESRAAEAPRRRCRTHDLGQKMYSGYHGVMLGMKSTTWAVSKKVG